MADGMKHPNVLLKIGFVNDKVEERLAAYKVRYLFSLSFSFIFSLCFLFIFLIFSLLPLISSHSSFSRCMLLSSFPFYHTS